MNWLTRFAPVSSRVLDDAPLQPQIEAWTDRSHLEEVVFHDITGVWPTAIGRERAMRVPAVSRGRHLTCGAIAQLPLYTFRGAEQVDPQPYWTVGTDGQVGDLTPEQVKRYMIRPQSPWYRMLWTVDDLLFYGHSLWIVTRRLVDGFPARMVRVPYPYWTINEHGEILDADGRPFEVPIVYFPGPHEGILFFGQDTITQAADLERTASDVARRPFRLELHQTTDIKLTKAERTELVAETKAALADNNGVLMTNSAIETKKHSLDSGELLVSGRNAAALDIARHSSIPAAMIDATTEGASLEYTTLESRNQHWIDFGLSLYMDPITSRLGMDDVVPAGQRTDFDTTELTTLTVSPTGPNTED